MIVAGEGYRTTLSTRRGLIAVAAVLGSEPFARGGRGYL